MDPIPETTASRQIFLSYSRSEMYFAEDVVLALQAAGFNIWFDLQQLEPGTNWRADIEAGLATSTALILIASRQALASPYVALEWRAALARGLPIHIVLFESAHFGEYEVTLGGEKQIVDTAPVLQHAVTVIDGRANFRRTTRRLISVLAGQSVERDSLPMRGWWGLPCRLPLSVGIVLLGMVLLSALLAWLALIAVTISPPLTIVFAVLGLLVANETRAFIYRKSLRGTRYSLCLATFIALLVAVGWEQSFEATWPELVRFAEATTLFFYAVWIVSVFSLALTRWSPRAEGMRRGTISNRARLLQVLRDFFLGSFLEMRLLAGFAHLKRWQKLLLFGLLAGAMVLLYQRVMADSNRAGSLAWHGFASLLLLRVLNALYNWRSRNAQDSPSGQRYHLLHNPADQPLADRVAWVMQRAGHTPVSDTHAAADYHLLLVSNFLTQQDIAPYPDHDAVRWIVLPIAPFEARPWHQRFLDYQWVDFRRHLRSRWLLLARELRDPQPERVSLRFSLQTTPQRFTRLALPFAVRLFVILMQGIIVSGIAFAGSVLLLARGDDVVSGRILYFAGFFVIVVAAFLWLHRLLASVALRAVSLRFLTGALCIAVTLFSLLLLYSAPQWGPALPLVYGVIWWVLRRWLGFWLPQAQHLTRETRAQRASPHIRRVLLVRTLLIALVATLLLTTVAQYPLSASQAEQLLQRAFFFLR